MCIGGNFSFHCNNLNDRKHKHKANRTVMQTKTVITCMYGIDEYVVNKSRGTSKTGNKSQKKGEGKQDTVHRDFERSKPQYNEQKSELEVPTCWFLRKLNVA